MKTSTKALTGVILCTVLVVSFLLLPSFIPSTGIDVPFEEIDKWWISGYESRDNLTIRDDETWETLWTEMESIHSHPADLPKINFTREMIIAVFQGERGSSGYWTNITRIIMTNAYYVVYVDEIHPGETCILLAVMTYPYHIVKISDLPLNLPVQFVYNIIIHDCG
jgi:hypothetical protein